LDRDSLEAEGADYFRSVKIDEFQSNVFRYDMANYEDHTGSFYDMFNTSMQVGSDKRFSKEFRKSVGRLGLYDAKRIKSKALDLESIQESEESDFVFGGIN
jgi:hypothetical protein